MMEKLTRRITARPYLSTAVIFSVLAAVGLAALNWEKSDFQLLLVLYFIVALGIRLDEISRKIGIGRPAATLRPTADDTLLAKLDEIALSLRTLNRQLADLRESGRKPPPLRGERKEADL